MALRSKVRLFPVDSEVYVAVRVQKYNYIPMHGVVSNVGRGFIEVILEDGAVHRISPNDRYMSLTVQECTCICNILNDSL